MQYQRLKTQLYCHSAIPARSVPGHAFRPESSCENERLLPTILRNNIGRVVFGL